MRESGEKRKKSGNFLKVPAYFINEQKFSLQCLVRGHL